MENHDTSKQQQSDDERRHPEWLFRQAVDSAVDGIAFIDPQFIIVYVNPARARMHGYEIDELLGKDVSLFYPSSDRPEEIRSRVASEGHWEGESTGLRKDGSTFPMWQSISRIDDPNGNMVAMISVTHDVTEEKQIRRERDEAMAHYRNLVENALVGVIRSTLDGQVLYTNQANVRQFQAEDSDLFSLSVKDFYASEEERDRFIDALKANGSVSGFEARMQTVKGEERTMLISATLADGVISGMLMDITDKKRSEEKLAKRSKQLMSLLEASREINSAIDVDSVLRLLVKQGMALVSANSGTAGLHIGGRMVFREYNSRGRSVQVDYLFRPGYGIPGWVMENRKPYLTNDAANDPHVIPHIRKALGFDKLVDVPIVSSDDRLLGCFELHNTAAEKSFTDEDVELLTGLANQAAVALVNADLTERFTKYADELKKNEETLRLVVEGSPDFFFYIQNRDGIFTYLSPSVEQITGHSLSDWMSHYTRFLTDNPINEDVIRNTERTLTTGEFAPSYPVEIFDKKGERLTLEVYERPIFEDDGVVGIRGVARDVTELQRIHAVENELRKQSEQQMRDFYRDALYSVTDGKLVMIDQEEARAICQDPLFPAMTVTSADDIPLARSEIAQAAVKSEMEGSKIDDLLLCVGEAAANAFKHAGGGVISVCEGEDSLVVKVTDHGQGMDSLALPKLTLMKGYSGTKSLGMGYATMLALADKVYLNTGPQGTTVVIEVAKQPTSPQIDLNALPDLW